MTFDRHMAVWPPGVSKTLALPDTTVHEVFEKAATAHPARDAIVYYGKHYTYADLRRMVDHLAGHLQGKAHVRKGDRVLIYMQNAPHYVIAYYAILKIGAVVIPVNPMNRQAELEHLLGDTGARVVIAGADLVPHLVPLADRIDHIIAAQYAEMADAGYDIPLPTPLGEIIEVDAANVTPWRDIMADPIAPKPVAVSTDDLAVIPYSSGTTGQPKGCMHSHKTVLVTALGSVQWNPTDEKDVHLVSLPFFHVTGMQSSMNGPLSAGGCLVIMSRWNREIAATFIERYKVTRWRSISTMAIDMVNDPNVGRYDLSSLQAIGGGGAAMPEAIAEKLFNITGLDYIEGYGLSETMAASHINPAQAPKRQCLGIPVFGVDCRVLDVASGAELGPGEVGEIVTAGPQMFLGYWNNKAATDAVFFEKDGKTFFHTGDLGYYDEQGYFFMVDRVKRMINAAGLKIWPAEVEALMHRHPDIAEACVIGAPDARRGETVKAYVVLQPGKTVAAAEIIEWCKGVMAAYKCPRDVVFVDALPKSGAGKVLWRVLMDQEKQAHEA